jgi:DNA mismatch endonuclease (patch repair protein)
VDPLTKQERSERMSRVRGTGNKSTELAVEKVLNQAGISGWVKHPTDVLGRPDFYFPECRLAVFVDGCFWHACPRCARRTPVARQDFWSAKIDENRRRDERTRRRLRRDGFHVMRVWEHEAAGLRWLSRLRRMLPIGCPR